MSKGKGKPTKLRQEAEYVKSTKSYKGEVDTGLKPLALEAKL